MRLILLILIFILPNLSWGQTIFTSSYTQHWPTIFNTEFEKINRTIAIDEEKIMIITETKEGKDIETLKIKSVEEVGRNFQFHCAFMNGTQSITVIIPRQERVGTIDIYKPSPETGEEIQIRLLVN